jgi:site-specific recombinase XerD
MKSNQTFSILFWINSSRAKEDQAELYARISINGKRVNLSLKEKVPVSQWDNKRLKLKGPSAKARQINEYIEATRNDIFQSYKDLKSSGAHITAQAVKARYLGEDQKFPTIQELINYHNEKTKHILHKDTQKHYRTSQKYILLYVKKEYKKMDCYLRDLDYGYIIGFENFLRSYKPNHYQPSIANNTIMKHIERLRKMVTMALHMEWIARDPFVKFKPKHIKTDRDFLTEEELQRIGALSCPLERLNLVQDLFVFSCFTGIAYGDLMLLTKKSIMPGEDGKLWIVIKRKKTFNQVKVPLLPKAMEIIKKYENSIRAEITQTLFPNLSNQKMNSYLKEIAHLCEIQKNLTFHMARHTFATTVTLTNGVPLETVSKLLGHSKIATTQIYARVIEKKVSEDMGNLLIKLNLADELAKKRTRS